MTHVFYLMNMSCSVMVSGMVPSQLEISALVYLSSKKAYMCRSDYALNR